MKSQQDAEGARLDWDRDSILVAKTSRPPYQASMSIGTAALAICSQLLVHYVSFPERMARLEQIAIERSQQAQASGDGPSHFSYPEGMAPAVLWIFHQTQARFGVVSSARNAVHRALTKSKLRTLAPPVKVLPSPKATELATHTDSAAKVIARSPSWYTLHRRAEAILQNGVYYDDSWELIYDFLTAVARLEPRGGLLALPYEDILDEPLDRMLSAAPRHFVIPVPIQDSRVESRLLGSARDYENLVLTARRAVHLIDIVDRGSPALDARGTTSPLGSLLNMGLEVLLGPSRHNSADIAAIQIKQMLKRTQLSDPTVRGEFNDTFSSEGWTRKSGTLSAAGKQWWESQNRDRWPVEFLESLNEIAEPKRQVAILVLAYQLNKKLHVPWDPLSMLNALSYHSWCEPQCWNSPLRPAAEIGRSACNLSCFCRHAPGRTLAYRLSELIHEPKEDHLIPEKYRATVAAIRLARANYGYDKPGADEVRHDDLRQAYDWMIAFWQRYLPSDVNVFEDPTGVHFERRGFGRF